MTVEGGSQKSVSVKEGEKHSKEVSKPEISDNVEHDDSMKKYEEELNRRFNLPEEEVPKDQEELIKYLTRRMQLLEVVDALTLQGVIDAMKAFIIDEEAKRQSLNKEQLDLQSKIGKLIQEDKLSIGDKVKSEIKAQLEDAAQQLLKAEKLRDQYNSKQIEQSYLIAELDGLVRMYHQEEEKNRKEVDLQKEMIETLRSVVDELQSQMDLKDGEILEKDEQIKMLKNELDDVKGVIFKLNDVRVVLNRVMEPYSQ